MATHSWSASCPGQLMTMRMINIHLAAGSDVHAASELGLPCTLANPQGRVQGPMS